MKNIEKGKIFYHLTGYLNKYHYICKHPNLEGYHIFAIGYQHLVKVIHDDEIEKTIFSSVKKAIEHEIEEYQKEFFWTKEFNGIPIEDFLREYFYKFIVERDIGRK